MPERKIWSTEEDDALKYLREQEGINKWSIIAKKLGELYNMEGRTGKQCRERYHNHLDSMIMHSEWKKDEQAIMYNLHDEVGNKWAIISQKLPGRTDNCVKNHFYSKLRKSIRKLNKTIHDFFKREFKEIKITILYKLIEAADEKFKNSPSIDEQVSQNCCRLKRLLLQYSNDDNEIQKDMAKVKILIKQIYQFSSSYRRKPKRCRKSSSHAHDLLKVPKFQKKLKSSSDRQESQGQFSYHHSQNGQSSDDDEIVHEALEHVMEEEDNRMELLEQKIQNRSYAQTLGSRDCEMESQQSLEHILLDGRIEFPVPYLNRPVDFENENAHMFQEQLMMNEKTFSRNLVDSDEDENKLFA